MAKRCGGPGRHAHGDFLVPTGQGRHIRAQQAMVSDSLIRRPCRRRPPGFVTLGRGTARAVLWAGLCLATLSGVTPAGHAATVWSDPGATLIHDAGVGRDILGGALKRDETSSDTLYLKFHIDPLSDSTTEEYFAALQLFEGDEPRLGIGNAAEAWAYTAFFEVQDPETAVPTTRYVDLRSSEQAVETSGTTSSYELPRRGIQRTIVFKIQYVAGGEDLITVWLNPDLSPGATEVLQPDTLTTRFSANASFDEVRLRHGGGGEGWVFSDVAIATAFIDFVDPSSAMPRAAASGPLFSRERLNLQTWNREPGMPAGAISALAQTADGYLWLAGENQLARFDGTRFVAWDLETVAGGGEVTCLMGDSNGSLWIGTRDRGLIRQVNGRFETITTAAGLPANTITALTRDPDGTVWIGTSAGVIFWRENEIHPVAGADRITDRFIRALFCDPSGALWIAVEGEGVFVLQHGTLSQLTNPQVDRWLRDPQCLRVGRDGRIWIGAGDDVVLCKDDSGWRRYRIPRRSGTAHVRALVEDTSGTVWAASASEGLFQFEQGRLVALNSITGLADNQVADLLLDHQGQLWVGGGAGLHVLRREHPFKLGAAEGLAPGVVAGVAEVSPGVLWAIQPGRGLFRWEGRSFRRLNAAGLDPGDPGLGALLVTRDGGCWMTCSNGLVLYRDPQAVADESLRFAFPHGTITALAEAHDGSLWAGTLQGTLWQLRRGEWVEALRLETEDAVTALVSEPPGSVWLATERGMLFRFDGSIQAAFTLNDRVPPHAIRALYRDEAGTLWIGTGGTGLAGLDNDGARRITVREGLPDNTIFNILEDRDGRLWLNDAAGLTCIARPDPAGRSVEVLGVYPMSGGSPEAASSVAMWIFPKGCRSSSGHLWFPTGDGIVVVEPDMIRPDAVAPRLILESVLVDGMRAEGFEPIQGVGPGLDKRTTGAAALRLGPGRHRVEVQYTSPDLGPRKRWQFRYRMEGLDPDWVEAGAARSAVYSYLPPGDYRFTVAAFAPHGEATQVGVGLSVSPYFWQRGWVMAGAAIALLAVIAGGARFAEKRRMDHRLRHMEQEHALERERTRIAQDLHDEMGAKLCRISFLSEHAGRLDPASGEIKEQIAAIAGDSRELLHSLDEMVWVVNPQNDTLEHLVSYTGQYAQNYFNGTGIDCEVDIASHLPDAVISSQARHHLFLAVHEALTNVLKHSGAGRVRVIIACTDATLGIEVTDDGRGFAVPVLPRGGQSTEESGNGLPNMHQRMESIGGRCEVDSTPGGGTTLRFQLGLKVSGKGRVNS